MDCLELVEKALRNIINGKNAFTFEVGIVQARLVKVMMEEGVEPTALVEKGLVRPIDSDRNKSIPDYLKDLVK